MTLLAVQQVVSRVLTDPAFREAFFRDPPSASVAYPLDPPELASLARLDHERVETCAFMLLRDRVRFALYAFPASATILSPLMGDLASRFAQEFPPVPTEEPRLEREGARFASFVLGLLATGELGPAYLGDTIVFEQVLYTLSNSEEAWRSAEQVAAVTREQPSSLSPDQVLASVPFMGQHTALRAFDHDVADLADRLARGDVPESPPRRPTMMLLTRTVESPVVRRQRVNAPTRNLLALCDGVRTAQGIIDELAAGVGAHDVAARERLAGRTVAALRQLRQAGVVGLVAADAPPRRPTYGDGERGPATRPPSEAVLTETREGSAT